MEVEIFLKGVILGVLIAAPLELVGVLCIQRTLKYAKFSGLFSSLGAAFADGIYAKLHYLDLFFFLGS